MPITNRAAVLAPGQIRHLLRVTEATSRHPERDAAILLLGLCCAMRCTETAQITVADILYPSGKLRTEVSLRLRSRRAASKGVSTSARPSSSPRWSATLSFDGRTASEHGRIERTQPIAACATICPYSSREKVPSLNSTSSAESLRLASTASIWRLTACKVTSRVCTPRQVSREAFHSGRRTFATRLYAQTADMDVVQQLLGHDSPDCTMRYIECDKRILRQAFIDVI